MDVGWAHAEGLPHGADARGAALDAVHAALGADLRVRARLDGALWLLFGAELGAELGASLAGLDARADERRVNAQMGPRMAVVVGAAWAP